MQSEGERRGDEPSPQVSSPRLSPSHLPLSTPLLLPHSKPALCEGCKTQKATSARSVILRYSKDLSVSDGEVLRCAQDDCSRAAVARLHSLHRGGEVMGEGDGE